MSRRTIQPWDLALNSVRTAYGTPRANSATSLNEVGWMDNDHTDASAALAVGTLGPSLDQTSATTDNNLCGITEDDALQGYVPNSLPWAVWKCLVSTNSSISWGCGWSDAINGFDNGAGAGVCLTDNSAFGHVAFVRDTDRSHTNILFVRDVAGGGSDSVIDTGVAGSKLTTGVIVLMRYLTASSVYVALYDAATEALLYSATVATDIPTTTTKIYRSCVVVTRTTSAVTISQFGTYAGQGIPAS